MRLIISSHQSTKSTVLNFSTLIIFVDCIIDSSTHDIFIRTLEQKLLLQWISTSCIFILKRYAFAFFTSIKTPCTETAFVVFWNPCFIYQGATVGSNTFFVESLEGQEKICSSWSKLLLKSVASDFILSVSKAHYLVCDNFWPLKAL